MSSGRLKNTFLPIAVIVAGFAAFIPLGIFLDGIRPQLSDEYQDTNLTFSGSKMKGYALGFEGLIADWYWMRALQYLGDKILNAEPNTVDLDDLRNLNPRLLYPYLETATDLDPHFIEAYSYGAIVMPAIDSAKAIAIAEKGIANNPNEWRLYQYLGYIYWKSKNYDKAAETYQKGSEIAGAPAFMKLMVNAITSDAGSRSTARKIFRQMLDGSDDSQVRIMAERRLNEFASLDERDAINKALAEIKETRGRCAESLKEILPSLRLVELPDGAEFHLDDSNNLLDPTGAIYLLDRNDCTVQLDREHTLLPKK